MKRLKYPPFIITLVIIVVVITMCLTGCTAYKAKICRSCATKTEVKDSIVYKTTVTPYDTLALIKRHVGLKQTFSNCDSLLKELSRNNDTITTTKDGVKSVITENKKGGITFHCETDSLKEIISLLRIQNDVQSFHKERIEVPTCHLEHITWWDTFWRKVGISLSCLCGAVALFFIAKLWFKF